MNLHILGKFNKEFVESAMMQVHELMGIPSNIEEIFFIDNPRQYGAITKILPKEIKLDASQFYNADHGSMSLTYKTFDLVILSMIKKEEQYLKKNKAALIGLIMHELSHISLRRKGLDSAVRKAAITAFKKIEPRLENLKYPWKDLLNLYADVGAAANLVLKDIYVNTLLVKKGLGKYILEDYDGFYRYYKKFYAPIFYHDFKKEAKCNLPIISQAICFELDLLSAFVPFILMAKKGEGKARNLVKFMQNEFEKNIPELSRAFDPVIKYALKEFDKSPQFREKFFRLIFESVYGLLN